MAITIDYETCSFLIKGSSSELCDSLDLPIIEITKAK